MFLMYEMFKLGHKTAGNSSKWRRRKFVPPTLSRCLCGAWGGKTTVMEYLGENHDLLFHANNSWKDISAFLTEIH